MKEVLISDKSLIYQWYFNDNMSVVDNYRVKATVFGNPTYNNGIVTFNGTTDYYKLKALINLGTKYSIEIKFKLNSIPSYNARLLGRDGSNYLMIGNTNLIEYGYGAGYNSIPFTRDLNWHTLTIARSGSNGQMYLDGIQKTTSPTSFNATAIGLISTICADDLGNVKLPCSIEYIKVWNRQLTASEVKNNYTGKTYRSLPYNGNERVISIINNPDLTTWSLNFPVEGVGSRTPNSITRLSGSYGVYLNNVLTTGKLYKYTIIGTNDSGLLRLSNVAYTNIYFGSNNVQNINISGYFIAYDTSILLYKVVSGTFTYSTFKIEEVLQSSKNTLFHINSDNGVIRDLTGKTTPINTNMTLKPLGSNIRVINGNGINSNVALGSNTITGDLTFLTVLNVTSLGEGSSNQYGMIFSNSKLQIWINDSINRIGVSRDGGVTKVYSNNNVIKFGKTIFLMVTTTSTGISNIYSCELNSNLTLASTANLSAGSLVDTAHLTYIGDDGTGNRTFNGWISNTMMIQGILTIEEGSQYVSSIKYKYQ